MVDESWMHLFDLELKLQNAECPISPRHGQGRLCPSPIRSLCFTGPCHVVPPCYKIHAGLGFFSLHHHVQTSSGAHRPSCLIGAGGFYHRSKSAREWSWHLHLVPRLRMCEAILPLPQYVFMVSCLLKQRDTFTLTFYCNGISCFPF